MQGEYRGDFTRDTFNSMKHFSRVLTQQGRVQLDADQNEQVSILLHYLRTLAKDLIGPHGGSGFEIRTTDPQQNVLTSNFWISAGNYYVHGFLCENEKGCTYLQQPDYPIREDHLFQAKLLVYLDVWERHISIAEDSTIGEVALAGIDTTTRAKVVWQVKTLAFQGGQTLDELTNVLDNKHVSTARLRARALQEQSLSTQCAMHPESRYRGAENQLYRVEIHDGGDSPTFKWSRDNGMAVFSILEAEGTMVTLGGLGRDCRHGLDVGDWVEVVDDQDTLLGKPGQLLEVKSIDQDENRVELDPNVKINEHQLLRRWDQRATDDQPLVSGAVKLVESNCADDKASWIDLEDGVQIQFCKPPDRRGNYRSGDYWLIPARVATGDVIWPSSDKRPEALPPHGVQHYWAPLAIIDVDNAGMVTIEANPPRKAIRPVTA